MKTIKLNFIAKIVKAPSNGHDRNILASSFHAFRSNTARILGTMQNSNLKWLSLELWRKNPFEMINVMLLIIALISTVCIPFVLWYDAVSLQTGITGIEESEIVSSVMPEIKNIKKAEQPSLPKWNFSRDYFSRGMTNISNELQAPINAVEAPGLAQRYSLLGILSGEAPKAIVRDNHSETTMFLSKGQHVNRYLVQKIFADHIILESEGELFELKL